VPALETLALESEQLAQIDSKDMDFETWQRLAQRAAHHLARDDVAGVVVTHGTDTLEETAYFLHRVLAPAKPLVLTAAMRPASSLQADGPQNLLDAVTVAGLPGARGVLVVMAGALHSGAEVNKRQAYRVDAFDSGDAGPLAWIEEGRLRALRPWPEGVALGLARVAAPPAQWPRIDICFSHAGADGAVVDALVRHGTRGIVVAGTGNASVHRALEAAVLRARAAGVTVWRCSRCALGQVVEGPATAACAPLPGVGSLPAVKARIELLLDLLAAG